MSESTNVGTIDLSLVLNSSDFTSQLNSLTKTSNTASTKIANSLKKIASAVAVAFSVTKIIQFGKTCLEVATETTNAWIGLNSVVTGTGKSFSEAQSFLEEYISDGLVPLSNAVTAYKNLAARGYSTEQIESVLTALKNSATYGRQSSYTLGEAVQTATEGLKNENSVLVDNAGVTKNVAKMWEEYADSIGKSSANLTQAEKIQAEVNGILEETQYQSNDAATYVNTYSGKVAQLTAAWTEFKTTVGSAIQALGKVVVPVLTKIVNALDDMFSSLQNLLALFGLEADTVENTSSSVSDSLEDTADSVEESVESAEKSLAGFDEVTKLSSDDDDDDDDETDTTEVIDSATDTASTVESIFSNISFDGLLTAVEEAGAKIKAMFYAIKSSFEEIWDSGIAEETLQLIVDVLEVAFGIVGDIAGAFTTAWNNAGLGTKIIQNIFNLCNDVLSTIVDIGTSFRNVWNNGTGEKVMTTLLTYFNQTLEILDDITVAFRNAWNDNDAGESYIQSILDELNACYELVISIRTSWQNVWNNGTGEAILSTILSISTNIHETWEGIYTSYKTAWEEQSKGESIIQNIYNAYLNVLSIVDDIANKMQEWWNSEKGTEYANAVVGIFETLSGWVEKLTEKIKNIWEGGGQHVFESLQEAWSNLTQIFGIVLEAMTPVLDVITDIIAFIADKALDTIGYLIDILNDIGDWMIEHKTTIEVLTGIVEAFFAAWAVGKIVTVASELSTTGGLFKTLGTTIANSGIATNISSIMSTAKIGVLYLKNVITDLPNTLSTAWSTISSGITTLGTNIGTGLETIGSTVGTAVSTIGSTISTGLSTIGTGLMTALSSPVTWIIVGIVALIAVIVLLATHWEEVCAVVQSVVEKIKEFVSGLVESIQEKFEAIKTFITETVPEWFSQLKEKISEVIENLKTAISEKIEAIKETFTTIVENIKTAVTDKFNAIKESITTVVEDVKTAISDKFNAIKETITTTIDNIKTSISDTFNSIKETITTIIDNIKTKISEVWNNIKTTITNTINTIKTNVTNVFTNIKNAIINAFETVKTKISTIWDNIWTTIKNVINKIIGGVETMINGVIKMLNKFLDGINAVSSAVGGIVGLKGTSLQISEITLPRLATGAYVKANTPQLAVIGDNKTQGEYVLPEDKLGSLLDNNSGGNNEKIISLLETMIAIMKSFGFDFNLYLDGDELTKTLEKRENKRVFATNGG